MNNTQNDSKTVGENITLPQIFVTEFDQLTCCQSNPVHRHPFYELVWVGDASATFYCDFKEYVLEPHTMAFIAPGQIHNWKSSEQASTLTIIGFTLEQLIYYGKIKQVVTELPFHHPTQSPFISLNDHIDLFQRLFDIIQSRFRENGLNHDDVLLAYFNVILVELERVFLPQQQPLSIDAGSQLTSNFRTLVEKNFLELKQVQAYADLLGVTLNHLVEIVRKTSGKTPKQILQERLLLEAKRLLIYKTDTIAEISYELDFSTPSYFGSWFKNLDGITPVQFRQQSAMP